MVNKALQSYATIQALWNNGGTDLSEIYAILSLKALDKALASGKNDIDSKELADYFKNEYGLTNITLGAATKFLKRLETLHDVVYKHNHRYVIKTEKFLKFRAEYPYEDDLSSEIDSIVAEISQYAKKGHHTTLSNEQITDGLVNFFDRYGGSVIIEQNELNDIATMRYRTKTTSQKIKYILSDYIINKEKEGAREFEILLNFAIGNIIASAISMQEFTEKNASLKNVTVYLDAPVIFNLLRLSGRIPYELVKDLIERLKKLSCRLVIGNVHYNEIINSIKYAIGLLNQEFPDLTIANRIYFNAKEDGLTSKDLELILQSLDTIIKSYGIDVVSNPPKEAGLSPLTEDEINNIIIDVFSENGKKKIPPHRKLSISRDATVISHVLMLRSGKVGMKLNDVGGILVTNNLGLCNIASEYLHSESAFRFPPVIITENLSTIIWANSSEKNIELHKKQLISECLAALRLKADMLRKFYNDIKIKHTHHAISDQDYLAAITSDLTQKILAEETFNDQNLYSDEVAMDVIKRINEINRISAQAEAEQSKKQVSETTKRIENFNKSILGKAIKTANIITNSVGILLAILFICNSYGLFKQSSGWYLIFEIILSIMLCGWGAWNWLGWIPPFKRIWIWIVKRRYHYLNQKYGNIINAEDYPDFQIIYNNKNK